MTNKKQKHDLNSLKEKIRPKQGVGGDTSITKRFAMADKTLGVHEQENNMPKMTSKVVKKTFSMPEGELKLINFIKDKALNKRIAISESEAIRLGILIATETKEDDLIKFIKRLEILPKGRPKGL